MIVRASALPCLVPLAAALEAAPYFNTLGQVAIFLLCLASTVFLFLVWLTVRRLLAKVEGGINETSALLTLVKSYLDLTGQQQREAARLVSETPNVVASSVKAAAREAISEARIEEADRKSGEMESHPA